MRSARRLRVAALALLTLVCFTSSASAVTFGPPQDEDPVWSSDGERIAFVRARFWHSSSRPVEWRAEYEVRSIRPDATGEGLLWRAPGEYGSASGPFAYALSPDWSQIAYELDDPDSEIVVAEPDGGNLRKLTDNAVDDVLPGGEAATVVRLGVWSPGGTQLLVSRRPNSSLRWDLYVAPVDGSGERSLVEDVFREAVWSTDGTRVAFVSPGTVEGVNADGSGRQAILYSSLGAWGLAWSPSGDRLAFITPSEGGGATLDITDFAGGWAQYGAAGRGGTPSWSPDGTQVAFRALGGGIAIGKADGSGWRRLTSNVSDDDPSWTPGGAALAFSSNRGCDRGIFLIRPDGSGLRRLTHDCRIFGTPGDDVIYGTAGRDVIYGFGGKDLLVGGASDDTIIGGAGDDRVFAGIGNDYVAGGRGSDGIVGGDGADTVWGGPGGDIVIGRRGADRLFGGYGRDVLRGGPGDDRFYVRDGRRDDLDGGDGLDTARVDRALDTWRRIEKIR